MSTCTRCGGSGRIEVNMKGGRTREYSCPNCVGALRPLPPNPPNPRSSP